MGEKSVKLQRRKGTTAQRLLFSALQHPNYNPKWISFVISKNMYANEMKFNHII